MYRKAMLTTGISAAAITAGYAVAAVMAIDEDIQIPARISNICLTIILGLCLMSFTAWLAQRAHLSQSADALADAVAHRLAQRIDASVNDAGDKNHARTVTAFREIVTSELICEQLEAATRRIHRIGMITEASGRADNVASIRRN